MSAAARREHRPPVGARWRAALALVLLAGAAGCSTDARAEPSAPELGPAEVVYGSDYVGDPFVLPVPPAAGADGRYVLFWTTDWTDNVPVAVSSDLHTWQRRPDALPVLPSWATRSRTMTWSPAALQVGDSWVLYFSTQEASSGLQCLGAAVSATPEGPYADASSTPLLCQRELGGDIDASVARDADGRPFLTWKNDGNANGVPTGLWQQYLSTDGRLVVGDPHRLLGVDRPWQYGIVEGPSMLPRSEGGWWLFYAAGAWQSGTYSTGVAVCDTVEGPCRTTSPGPLLTSRPGAVSPGGLETFRDLDGTLRAVYSTFDETPGSPAAAIDAYRVLQLATVEAH